LVAAARSGKWAKQGPLWAPPGKVGWGRSHAALPTLDPIDGNRHWLYFSSRDESGRSLIGRVEVELRDGRIEIGRFDPDPVIGLGKLGTFDDSGVTNSWIVADGERRLLYYSGWSLGVTVPFYFYAGLAISEDGGRTFQRHSEAPILERDDVDPYLTASPCVLRDDGRWRMWYVSGTGWAKANGELIHRYHIKYAESRDGLAWDRPGIVCIDYAAAGEYAISRPCVVRTNGVYRMWFAARGASYRMGYAESDDGLEWRRDDRRAGLEVSSEGWDTEMVCYPFVRSHGDHCYMLYNGNGYGRTGIGYAVKESE
jgi:hypothetical protein